MRFDREMSIRCLNIIGAPDPAALGSKPALIFNRADVLDDGVAVNNFKCFVSERQFPNVGENPPNFAAAFPFKEAVHNGYARMERHQRPVEFASAEIEYLGLGRDIETPIKELHATLAEPFEKLEDRLDIHFCFAW